MLALKFVEGVRHIPNEAALQELEPLSLTHRRVRGDLISMFKITVGLLEFLMESAFAHPTRTGLCNQAHMFNQHAYVSLNQ